MPIREVNCDVYFLNSNNEYEKMETITDFAIDSQSDNILPEELPRYFNLNKEDDFSLEIAINHQTKKVLTKLIFGKNNWRRRHGLPMKSCKRYQHEKR